MAISGWIVIVVLVAIAGVGGIWWWRGRKARQSASDLAESLADSNAENTAARADADNRAALENASDRLDEAARKLNEKAKLNGKSPADYWRDRGAGK